ncbi:MAG: type II toxin-antitoxin system HicB family antitoxin [Spirochaetaceae bacterium]|nr:type II toxin-antitoxin system HicB family antitoxin [Spirochaetaceae bacterium]
MTYNCDITKENDKFVVRFPDMPNAVTFGNSMENALFMAQDVLNGILASHIDNGYPISEPKYNGGYPVEVSPKVAFALELRKARANHSQKEVAQKAGMTYQQYQRLENPHKTNPTLETIYKLQKIFNRQFLAL